VTVTSAAFSQSLVRGEIDEITHKIRALDDVRQNLEQDLLRLQEDDLELDDERKSHLPSFRFTINGAQWKASKNECDSRKLFLHNNLVAPLTSQYTSQPALEGGRARPSFPQNTPNCLQGWPSWYFVSPPSRRYTPNCPVSRLSKAIRPQ
jgi:hypothetical protein